MSIETAIQQTGVGSNDVNKFPYIYVAFDHFAEKYSPFNTNFKSKKQQIFNFKSINSLNYSPNTNFIASFTHGYLEDENDQYLMNQNENYISKEIRNSNQKIKQKEIKNTKHQLFQQFNEKSQSQNSSSQFKPQLFQGLTDLPNIPFSISTNHSQDNSQEQIEKLKEVKQKQEQSDINSHKVHHIHKRKHHLHNHQSKQEKINEYEQQDDEKENNQFLSPKQLILLYDEADMMQCVGRLPLNDLTLFEGNELNNISLSQKYKMEDEEFNQLNQYQNKDLKSTKNFIFHSMTCVTTPKRKAHLLQKRFAYNSVSIWNDFEQKYNQNKELIRIGSKMSSSEMDEQYAKTIICVAGREINKEQQQTEINSLDQNKIETENQVSSNPPIFTDIFLFEVIRDNPEKQIKKLAQFMKENGYLNIKNKNEIQKYQKQLIEKIFKENNQLGISYSNNEIDIGQISFVLFKKIRILGGVQGLHPNISSLYVLYGKALMLFTISDGNIWNENDNQINNLENDQEKDENIDENNNVNNNITSIYDFCSCSVPYFSRENKKNEKISSILPYHYSINEIRSIENNQKLLKPNNNNNNKQKDRIDYQKWVNYYNAFRRCSTIYIQMQFFLEMPSPITSVSSIVLPNVFKLWEMNYSNLYQPIIGMHKILLPQYLRILFCQRIVVAYAPCGVALFDIQFNIDNPIMFEQEIKLQRFQCIFDKTTFIHQNIQQFNEKEQNKVNYKNNKHNKQINNKNEINADDKQEYKIKLKKKKKLKQNNTQKCNQNQNKEMKAKIQKCKQQETDQINNSINLQQRLSNYYQEAISQILINSKQTDSNKISQNQCQEKEYNIDNQNIINQQLQESQLLRPITFAAHMIKYYKKLWEKHGKKLTQIQLDLIFAYYARPKINLLSSQQQQQQQIKCLTAMQVIGHVIALSRTPSLIIDAKMIGENEFCVISDKTILYYSLIPNVQHKQFFPIYKSIMDELKQYPFDVNLFNGLVFEDKDKLDEEEQQYFKNIKEDQLMFNLVVQAVIPQTNCAQFILPSTIGQQTLYGGINGQYSHLFKLLNREVHKSTNELSAFTSMVFDLMSQTMEKEGKEKCDLSLTDAGQLAHQFYLDELDMNQNKQQLEGQKNIVRFNKDLSHSKISNWRHKAILMSGCSSTDYNILQCIPSIKPFVLLSRHGQISCGIPVRYDQLPFRDLGMRTFSSAVSAANFGNRWINPQAQLFPSYDEYEGIQYRKYVQMEIDEELAESGTLSIIPQYSVMRYHIPVYPLRIGKFYDSQILYGISPHPIQAENYQWRTLEPWQIRKTVTMMGVEQDVRQRWKLSERERIRNLLGLAQNSDDEEKDQQLNATLISNKTKEQKQQLIKLLKEIRNNDHEEDVKKRFNQLRSDLIDTNMIFNESNNQNFKTDSQTQISLLKGKVKSLSTYIYPEITTSNTELTIHQPTMVHLQEQMSQQYQKKNDILLYLTNDTLEHPIPLNNIQKATIQEHLLKLPKEYL